MQLRALLKDVQQKSDKDPYNKEVGNEECEVLKQYAEEMKDEEQILYQKAKVKWLSVGNRNNAYFHKSIKSIMQRNRIDAISDENGKIFMGIEVADQFVRHFQKFMGESVHVEHLSDMDKLIKCKLSAEEANDMVREINDDEIKNAITWSITGKDVCLAIKEFFETRNILKGINSTLIALVPKIQTPLKVSDFRLIACCNVIYKCISKIITERLKWCLDKLVSKNQSTFIPNRHIQDNIMLAQELFKGYDRNMRPNRVALKVDIQKDYDTVNWKFLEDILKGFGFHELMINWTMKCVSTTSFSICVNVVNCGYFRGWVLRQGDLMSPYLFTLVMEILTLMTKSRVDQNMNFKYHFRCKKLIISNVCFVVDLLMFCHDDRASVSVLKKSIEDFGRVYGLIPNYNKSIIIFGSLSEEEKQDILDVVPFKMEKLPI
ncbi:RNA-directed DNA polymerase, eukaryota, reverse transcriptase zinc-binding domain protein [Tanacetum coccineum]